jgi:hypothetical protein
MANRVVDEEPRTVLRRIVEAQAYRQLMAMNIRGHCLKYFTDLESKVRVAEELHLNLTLLREVSTLYRELGWENVESAVRDKMASIPYPESRLEFGVFRHVCGLALEIAMRCYVDSSSREFAAIARSFLDGRRGDLDDPDFAEFCADPSNRPRAQQMLERWFAIGLRSLGRPGTRGDARAVELGLRTHSAAAMIARYTNAVHPIVERLGLRLPDPEELGLSV